MGRQNFCNEHGITLDRKYSVRFFLDCCKDAYGGDVIRKLREEYEY